MSEERAVVIGASIAGVLAARALKDRFREVVLVERDHSPAPGEHRKGVPQARHAHVLLSTGKDALERLLPGTVGSLLQDGFHCRFPSDIPTLMVSRVLVEQRIRERVLALPGVLAREGCDGDGLSTTADRRRVTGIRLSRRQAARPRRNSPPTWWWTPRTGGRKCRPGWSRWATPHPSGRRGGSTWRTPRAPSAAPPSSGIAWRWSASDRQPSL